MKILFYTPRFYPLLGGLERVARLWAEELTAMGNEVVVLTQTASAEKDDFRFSVYRRPGFIESIRIMKQADIIVQFNISLKGLPAGWLSKRPLVISHHTLLINDAFRYSLRQQAKRWISNKIGRNVCCSQYVATQFKCATVINSPYENALFGIRNLPRRAHSILFVGRLVHDKGVDILIDALDQLMQNEHPVYELTIIGDGELRNTLEQKVLRLPWHQQVTFTGACTGEVLVQAMNTHEILVVPSRVEPFGTVVLEGLAAGCRVISANTGGLPEAAGGFATLFEHGNAGALAKAIAKQFSMPSSTSENSSALAEFLIGKSVSKTAEQLEAYLAKCL